MTMMKTLSTLTFTLAMFGTAALADTPKPADKAPAPMAAPKPAQELLDMAKGMEGTWKCTGKAVMGPAPMDFTANITIKLELDKFWMQTQFSGTAGKVSYKFTSYTGYDAMGKKWHRMGVDNMGAARMSESSGMTDGKMIWEGNGMQMGQTVKLRDTEEMTKDGKTFHTVGEMSMDGKTWKMGHDATCKK